MENVSSGCYMIDEDYNVISVNDTAKKIYPQLEVGKKCYRCLSHIDEPCGPCPVHNRIKGPRTYRDPIRDIMESVDAVEIPIAGHGICHALVFSTVGNEAKIAATLPTNAEDLRDLAYIKAFTSDLLTVLLVDVNSEKCFVYRDNGVQENLEDIFHQTILYQEQFEAYVKEHVIEEDRSTVLENGNFDHIKQTLKKRESFVIHFRTMKDQKIHYYNTKIVRIGQADDFENFIIGIGCEDDSVAMMREMNELEKNLSLVEVDTLTHLYTKEAFRIYGEKMRHDNPDVDFDFCVLRVDDLTSLNIQYGITQVDRLLELIGQGLIDAKNEYTCLTYMGSGVFACYRKTMQYDERKNGCAQFAEMIKKKTNMRNLNMKWSVYVTPRKELTVDEIIEKTNYALSTIRANGNQDYVEFDQKMVDQMEEEKRIENIFETALKNHEISVWYQPKYDSHTKEIVGAEALARWKQKDGKMISPGQFIPILEKSGKIRKLDGYVFEEVCKMEMQLLEEGDALPISVNLSRVSVYDDNVADAYYDIAMQYGNIIKYLPIEITESAAVSDVKIHKLAQEFTKYGFILHMDDFGAGFSTLAALETLPFTTLKLDKSLVDLIGKKDAEALLKHTVAYAKETGKGVVAEGVENKGQYDFLKQIGCDTIQGFYFARPMDENAFKKCVLEKVVDRHE